jgi:hypothetical protein
MRSHRKHFRYQPLPVSRLPPPLTPVCRLSPRLDLEAVPRLIILEAHKKEQEHFKRNETCGKE